MFDYDIKVETSKEKPYKTINKIKKMIDKTTSDYHFVETYYDNTSGKLVFRFKFPNQEILKKVHDHFTKLNEINKQLETKFLNVENLNFMIY